MMTKLKNHCLNLPPRFSMDEYVDAVDFQLNFKAPLHIQKQKDMEEFIQTPFSFDQVLSGDLPKK